MTLADARQGQRLVLGHFTGSGARNRLWDLGIVPGAFIHVLAKHPFRGPLVVGVDGIRVAVGRALAAKIPVTKA